MIGGVGCSRDIAQCTCTRRTDQYIKLLIRKYLHFGAISNLNKLVDASCKDAGQAFVGGNCAKGDYRVE